MSSNNKGTRKEWQMSFFFSSDHDVQKLLHEKENPVSRVFFMHDNNIQIPTSTIETVGVVDPVQSFHGYVLHGRI